jgi:flagellar basal body-associated protein FliL
MSTVYGELARKAGEEAEGGCRQLFIFIVSLLVLILGLGATVIYLLFR